MNVLIWLTVLIYSLPELAHGESNPYKEALLARPWESEQAYVTVRPGAHMFYWLYYADGTRVCAETKPLIIWIQGGPGFAASGLGNFAEIGPFNMEMEPRKHTWVKGRNVLFIDHPVGTGFSYVEHKSLLAKTDRELVSDLSETIKAFFKTNELFNETPTYLFGQSYGSKICTRLAYCLHKISTLNKRNGNRLAPYYVGPKNISGETWVCITSLPTPPGIRAVKAIQRKDLKMNLKGVGIGSGWVNPKESALVYPEYLYYNGMIDQKTYFTATEEVKNVSELIDKQEYDLARERLHYLCNNLYEEAGIPINFNNIYQASPDPALDLFQIKVNTYVKPMLSAVVNQTLEWQYIPADVYFAFNKSLLVPTTKFLELLLNRTEIKVAVYNGNLDVLTSLAGASNWVHKLKWHGSEQFKNATRIRIQGGFYKETKQLSLWWVIGAGHWVPEDNPAVMEQILEYVISPLHQLPVAKIQY